MLIIFGGHGSCLFHLEIIDCDLSDLEIEFRDECITILHRGWPLDLKQLRAFLTVADTGNVTRASELLNLVQPAVSRQLRLLEQDLEVRLFQRERHGMVLTEAGRALSVYAHL
jgi:Bacterial regulatory helix-turn-helix protein, lysR family